MHFAGPMVSLDCTELASQPRFHGLRAAPLVLCLIADQRRSCANENYANFADRIAGFKARPTDCAAMVILMPSDAETPCMDADVEKSTTRKL